MEHRMLKAVKTISSGMDKCPNINSHNNYKLCKRCMSYASNVAYKLEYTPEKSNKRKRKYNESWF